MEWVPQDKRGLLQLHLWGDPKIFISVFRLSITQSTCSIANVIKMVSHNSTMLEFNSNRLTTLSSTYDSRQPPLTTSRVPHEDHVVQNNCFLLSMHIIGGLSFLLLVVDSGNNDGLEPV